MNNSHKDDKILLHRARILFTSGAAILGLNSCAQVSDNPREGGLIGYLQHGDKGYQQRLNQRGQHLSTIEQDTSRMRSSKADLQRQRDAERSRMAALRSSLSGMDTELGSLESQLAKANISDPSLRNAIAAQRRKAESLKYDDSRSIGALEAERNKLEREIANLRQRAALALEL